MTRIVLDAALLEKLHRLAEPLELCDEEGRVLADVIPRPNLSDYELSEPPISEEELRRREQSDKWYTTEQVLAHLRSLEKQ